MKKFLFENYPKIFVAAALILASLGVIYFYIPNAGELLATVLFYVSLPFFGIVPEVLGRWRADNVSGGKRNE